MVPRLIGKFSFIAINYQPTMFLVLILKEITSPFSVFKLHNLHKTCPKRDTAAISRVVGGHIY